MLSGPFAIAATLVTEVVTPEQTSRDFTEIIDNSSGRASLADKQEAFREMWVAYHKFGKYNWNAQQKRELLQLTEHVYRNDE